MAKVLQCSATVGPEVDAFATKTFAAQSDVYVGFRYLVPAATLTTIAAAADGDGLVLLDLFGTGSHEGMNVLDDAGTPKWYSNFSSALAAVPADTWVDVDVRLQAGSPGNTTVWLNGVQVYLNADATASNLTTVKVGIQDIFGLAAGVTTYLDDLTIGTSGRGSTDLFSEDFEGVTPLSNFDSTTGSLSVVDDPFPAAAPAVEGRVLIAFDDDALAPDPTWTRIDDVNNLVREIQIRTGRQTEFDQTETGTATVFLNDTDGDFDPENASSPYYGKIDGAQIMLQLQNPVTSEWFTRFRGWIEDYGYDLHPSQVVSNIQLECVDIFDFIGGVEMLPGVFGDPPPAGSEGVVFYEDTDFQDRVEQLLTDAAVPADRYRVFTGNVDVQETKYDPGDSVLAAIRDALDAEFPGIARDYCDRKGRYCAHGRKARFDPETTAVGTDWEFTRWKAGDGTAVLADSDRAQIRPPLTPRRPRSRIINAAIAWPRYPLRGTGGGTFREQDIPDQITVDATSRDKYGYHAAPAMGDLITLAGTTTGNDAKAETKLFADYYVQNYKDPHTRVEAVNVKAIALHEGAATATWALLCGCDISDGLNLRTDYPGGTGLKDGTDGIDFFIEGWEQTITPLNPDYDMVDLTLNLSPAAYYATDVFITS